MAYSQYAQSLDGDDYLRYMDKIEGLHGIDPYALTDSEMSTADNLYPLVETIDIQTYMVFRMDFYTGVEMKSYRSLESHNYLTSGKVKIPLVLFINDLTVLVKTQVAHSQSLHNTPLVPWVSCKPSGVVHDAHCTCMAGLGGACSHIGALLFYFEARTRLRETPACTSLPNMWLGPHKSVMSSIASTDMTSSRRRKIQLDKGMTSVQVTPRRPPPPMRSVAKLLQGLHDDGLDCPVFRVTPGHSQRYAVEDTTDNICLHLNKIYHKDSLQLPKEALLLECIAVFKTLRLSVEECQAVEKETRGQSKNHLWAAYRAGRITSSNVYDCLRTNLSEPSLTLIKKICFVDQPVLNVPAIIWGCEKEALARQHYRDEMSKKHSRFLVKESGLFLNPCYVHLGASPDGITNCTCCGQGLLEIKCPFQARNSNSLADAIKMKNFYLILNDVGAIILNPRHRYFYQMQHQMFVCGKAHCDFYVWTPHWTHNQRVLYKEDFFSPLLPKLSKFFINVILPELKAHLFTKREQRLKPTDAHTITTTNMQPQPSTSGITLPGVQSVPSRMDPEPTFCICKKPASGRMIGCSHSSCDIEWFHYTCLGIKRHPQRQRPGFVKIVQGK